MLAQRRMLFAISVLTATAAHAAPPARPDLATAKPIATCKLVITPEKPPAPAMPPNTVFYQGRNVEDPLSSYERTSLGDWPILAAAERTDPWIRLVLLTRKRPVVIDLAILIDGKSFRDKRDSWIDEQIAASKSGEQKPTPPVTKPADNKSQKSTESTSSPPTPEAAVDNAEDNKRDAKELKPDSGPKAAVQARHKPTMRERLDEYLSTNQSRVDREELGWLIASWGAGPGVVLLDPSLSWQRSELSPLETFLDENGDGAFSRDEIAQSGARLQKADVDANDVVDVAEIRKSIRHAAFALAAGGYPLVFTLDSNTDALALEAALAKLHAARPQHASPAQPSADTIDQLKTQPADLSVRVDFNRSDSGKAGISVLSLAVELAKSREAISAAANTATVDIDGDYIEFSGTQVALKDEAETAVTQIAIGAIFDGNPLLRLLDRDNDSRLTRRERQAIPDLFASLDHNGDGTVSSDEVPIPIRFAVTLGPHVHQLLATASVAARTITTRVAASPAPAWFTSMDKNSDGDLSRSEFLGTTEQFKQFDKNGDDLLSVAEVQDSKIGK